MPVRGSDSIATTVKDTDTGASTGAGKWGASLQRKFLSAHRLQLLCQCHLK